MGSQPNSLPQFLGLPERAIHVWTVALDSGFALADSLSRDEQERAQRFYFDRDRRRFVAARSALRRLLALYLQTSEAALAFQYSKNGKPRIAVPASDLCFNVSHADAYALLAFRRGGEIGVDIEKVRPEVETGKLAERFFSETERDGLRAMDAAARLNGFFQCWTSKEALLKAWGTGLTVSLASFDVEVNPNLLPALLATRPDADLKRRWRLYHLDAPPDYLATLAVEAGCEAPRHFQYQNIEKLLDHTLSF